MSRRTFPAGPSGAGPSGADSSGVSPSGVDSPGVDSPGRASSLHQGEDRNEPAQVLLATADPELGRRLAGLAAAAGVPTDPLPALPAGWSRRPGVGLVLVDATAVVAMERRDGVVLVCTGEPDPPVWRRAVELGAERVVTLPEGESWLLDRILDVTRPGPAAPVLGVIGGRGGAGASTLAVGLAAVAARSKVHTVLVDADPLGGGLDLLVGMERERGLRWKDLSGARGRLQPGLLSSLLPTSGGLTVLSWGRPATDVETGGSGGAGDVFGHPSDGDSRDGQYPDGAGSASFRAGPGPGSPGSLPVGLGLSPVARDLEGCDPGRDWGGSGLSVPELDPRALTAVLDSAACEFDLVVVDLSRRFGAADLAALRVCRTVVLLVPAEVRATAAASGVRGLLDFTVADQRLVVRSPAPSGLPAEAVADALGLPLAGELRSESAVAAALDRGEPLPDRPRGALTVLSRRLLTQVLAA